MRGAQIGTVPEPTVSSALTRTALTDHQPLAVLIDLIDERRHVLLDLGLSAAAIIRRAPSRARSSSVRLASLSSPTGGPRTSTMACLPAGQSPASVLINREGTPPSFSSPSTTSGRSQDRASRQGPPAGSKGQSSRRGLPAGPRRCASRRGPGDRASRRGVPAGAASGMAAPRSGRRPRLEREASRNPSLGRRESQRLSALVGGATPGNRHSRTLRLGHSRSCLADTPLVRFSSVRPMKISSNIGHQQTARFARSGTTSNAWKTLELTRTSAGACLDGVRGCDALVGIYGHRYGFVPEGGDASITELEVRRGRPSIQAHVLIRHPT